MTFLNRLINSDRLLQVLYDTLPPEIKTSELYSHIVSYLDKYVHFNSLPASEVIRYYTDYITSYNKHCKAFIKSGKYPFENENGDLTITREAYDIILLLSVLLTPHRFRIMQLLHQQMDSGKALFIGLGPGLEMSITRHRYSEVHAYDLALNDFLQAEFAGVYLKRELYSGQLPDYFDTVYLIEILEHLKDPYQLLDICSKSLKRGGKVFLTTATDIPQFDHLYNFSRDHTMFEEKINRMGFTAAYKEMIPHHYLTLALKPCNHFYILEK